MTDAEFLAWLKSDRPRVVLVEVGVYTGGSETTRYMATAGYNTGAADTPANMHYEPVVAANSLQFTEALDLTGDNATLNVGDIEIYNHNGERDSWFLDVWQNRTVQAFVGDPSWVRSDFRMIFNGVVAMLSSPRDRTVLNLKMADKLQRLNTPLSEDKLGGTTPNKDAVLPNAFGEVHNITPLLTDPVTLRYMGNNGSSNGCIEVRDNGKPVPVTTFDSTGEIELDEQSAGAITMSYQGAKDAGGTYRNTLAGLVKMIVKEYGQASNRFVDADIDLTQFSSFDAAHTQPMGIFCSDRTNVLAVCRQLADSLGTQLVMTRLGKLQLIQIDMNTLSPTFTLTQDMMVEKTLKIREVLPVTAAIKLGFCKNWSVQNDLLTTIPDQHKELFAQEWLVAVKSDSTVQTRYKLNAEPVQQDTMLLRAVDAEPEAQRQLDTWKVQRVVYEFEGTPELLHELTLGQHVTLQHPRFNLSGGSDGLIVSLTPNWQNCHVVVGVMV
jgi:hypothetical protein